MLNNHKKEQFMNRSGSYSTHGSRRGYSDLGLPMEYNDLLPPQERRKIIINRFNYINSLHPSTKKDRQQKNTLQCMLNFIREEIKQHNISSSTEYESRMNFGRFFLEFCRKNMPRDYYLSLANAARKEFDEIN